MEIGAINVRATLDPSGLTSGTNRGVQELRRLEGSAKRSMSAIGGASKSAIVPTNQLASVFTTLASQASGANPALTRLGSVIGQFAVGGGVVAGALAGVTVLSAAWNFFTREARAAKEETEKLITKLGDLGKAKAAATVPGLQAQRVGLQSQFDSAVAARDRAQRRSIMAGGDQTSGLLKAREDVLSLSRALLVNEQEIKRAKAAFDQMISSAQSIEGVNVTLGKTVSLTQKIADLAGSIDFGFGDALDKRLGVERAAPVPAPEWVKKLLGWSPARITGPAPGRELDGARTRADDLKDALKGLASDWKSVLTGKGGDDEDSALSGVLGQLTGSFQGLMASLGPMAIVAEVLNGVFAAIEPVLDALMVPLRDIGFLIGSSIAPLLKVLQPVLNAVAKAFSYVIQAQGEFLKGIGKFINFILPGNPANGLVEFGQNMIDMARQTRKAIDAGTDLTKTMDKVNGSLSNVPSGFKTALARFNATSTGMPTGSGSGGGVGGIFRRTAEGAINVGTIKVYANDPEEFTRKVRQAARRGGAMAVQPAY